VAALAQQAAPGQRVVLLAGAAHVDAGLGVPRHLPAALGFQTQAWPAQPPKRDYCEDLRRSMAPAAGSGKPAAEAPAPVGTTPPGR
jgi:hypothetical protein